jgi:hypothetical protein
MPKYHANNVYYKYLGEVRTLTEWAEITGIKRQTLQRRVEMGWDMRDVLYKEVRDNSKPRGTKRG